MNESMGRAPLWEALTAYAQKGVIPFHTPGHKLHPGLFHRIEEVIGKGFLSIDPSDEVEHEASGHQFESVLAEAEALAAEAFGSGGTLFLTNGTTGGLQAALLPQTGKILIPRFSHQSVYTSVALSGAEPVFLPAMLDSVTQLPLQPSVNEWTEALTVHRPRCAVVTYPTYYGSCVDLEELVRLSLSHNCELIVDEAHGAHFRFHPRLPLTAMEAGASISVQSTHKTLGALTGSSMLHARDSQVMQRCRWAHSYLQTTSPSLPALGVLDEVRRSWQEQGMRWLERLLERAAFVRNELEKMEGVVLAPAVGDPTKIVFSLSDLGLSGPVVERRLRNEHKIQLEMSEHRWAVAYLTVGDTFQNIDTLVLAISSLAQEGLQSPRRGATRKDAMPWPSVLPEVASARMLDVSRAATRLIPLQACEGEVSAVFVTPYPPGVPLLVPGEVWNDESIAYVRDALAKGWHVRGLEQEMVWVVEDSTVFCRIM